MNKKQGENRRVFTVGETVYDLQLFGGKPVSGRPGGSMLNTAVSLGRLGLSVFHISEFSDDEIGNIILEFLTENNVNTKHSCFYKKGKTPLALAFLNEDRDANFSFYKEFPEKRFDIRVPAFKKNDILLFGSFFSMTKEVRSGLMKLLEKAVNAGVLIIYDPNFRRPHYNELSAFRGFLEENIARSSIIRGSTDDFAMIFNTHHIADTYNAISELGCEHMLCTSGSGPVNFRSPRYNFFLHPPEIDPTSTVGAGDSFNAGLIYSLSKLNINREDLGSLKKQEWQTIAEVGMAFGTSVCESYDNYISPEFASRLRI